jgi:glycerol-3-phosphate acyltransferase PlsY
MAVVVLGVVLMICGYLVGSIPFGLLVARIFAGVDVRSVGSGNIGATNVGRAAGVGPAVLTLVLDALKGAVPVSATTWVLAGEPEHILSLWRALVGLAAFLGHVFPLWLGFRGGKGVATALGVFAVLAPWAALVGLGTYGVFFLLTRISAVGSLAGTAAAIATIAVQRGIVSAPFCSALGIGAVIVARHRSNLAQLRRSGEAQR